MKFTTLWEKYEDSKRVIRVFRISVCILTVTLVFVTGFCVLITNDNVKLADEVRTCTQTATMWEQVAANRKTEYDASLKYERETLGPRLMDALDTAVWWKDKYMKQRADHDRLFKITGADVVVKERVK